MSNRKYRKRPLQAALLDWTMFGASLLTIASIIVTS